MKSLKSILAYTLVVCFCLFLGTLFPMADSNVDTTASEYNNEKVVESTDLEKSFWEEVCDIFTQLQTVIPLVCGSIFGICYLLFKKDVPKLFSLIYTGVLFFVVFCAKVFFLFNIAELLTTILIIIIMSVALVTILKMQQKSKISYESANEKTSKKASNDPEKVALKAINRHTSRSHPVIKCIQLYHVSQNNTEKIQEYHINLAGGNSKKGVNINAIFSATISIPTEYINSLNAVKKMYEQFSNDESFDKVERDTLSLLISKQIDLLKQELDQLKKTEDITEIHCYLARLLLLYISLYAAIENHDIYVGFGHDSLGLANCEVEQALLSIEKTGILGAILFEHIPYVFSYKGNGHKNGRFYYTFSCDDKSNYIAMVALKNRGSGEPYIDGSVSENLSKIKAELNSIFTTKQNVSTHREAIYERKVYR
jgi:hypothetical protein